MAYSTRRAWCWSSWSSPNPCRSDGNGPERRERRAGSSAPSTEVASCRVADFGAQTIEMTGTVTKTALPHEHVPELPGVALVDVLGEEAGAFLERGPVGVNADHRAEIGRLHFE